MAYIIYKSDGTAVTIIDNTINETFYDSIANGSGKGLGTQLIGKNIANWGAATAQNFLQLRENFCGTVMPSDLTALQGQLWFNKLSNTSGDLYVRKTNTASGGMANWQKIGTVTSVALSGGTTGLTVTGSPITSSGTITLSGTLVAANGGTGLTTYATGDILYASAANTLSKLTTGTTGQALVISGGIPSWGAGVASLSTSSGSSQIGFIQTGINATTNTVQSKLRESVSIFDFMSAAQISDVQAGTLLLDCAASFNSAIAASKNIYFPPGKYRFNSTITITGARGLTLCGAAAALLTPGTGYSGTTELYFNNAASGSDGLVLTDFLGVSISNMTIVMRRGGAGGGKALFMYNGHDYSLKNVNVDVLVGASGRGVQLGNGSGATATFIGHIQNVKVMSNGAPGIYANFGTSSTFTACYVIGGWMQFDAMTYVSAVSCAVDASTLYGYIINGSSNLVFSACGAEGASKGAFYLSTTASNIVIDAPYGAANNTSADASIGDLVQLDSGAGAVNSITINNPTSVSPNAATAQNIYANAGTGFVEVYNTDLTLLSRGINGHSVWVRDKLTVTGVWDQLKTWTPTLVGWTNTGSPTVVGKYYKRGKIVTFYVTITPGTNISCTRSTSSITGFPFSTIEIGSATMTDGNANSYGSCVVGPTGIIYPQTSGVLTVGINIVGTIILP
jgi:hypothetical protein